FIVNTFLFGTYYAVAKNALGHIDPVMFSYFEMMTLVPAGLCILLCCWRRMTRAVVKRGMMLGSSLCLALFTISIALKYTSATSTAFFPSLNGFLAAIIAWFVLRQPVTKATWVAGVLSFIGTAMLILSTSMDGLRGVLIAFLGGVFFTIYVFLSDSTETSHSVHEGQKPENEEIAPLPLFGIELLTMAVWANLIVLLFGDWHTLHLALPQDAWTILYVAAACTFVPTLLAAFMQKHVSPVTVSFIYILEPVFGAIIAYLYLHETLPLYGYIGGVLVVFGAVIHTWGMAKTVHDVDNSKEYVENVRINVENAHGHVASNRVAYRGAASSRVKYNETRNGKAASSSVEYKRATSRVRPANGQQQLRADAAMMVSTVLYPVVLVSAAILLFARLDGLPPIAWRVLSSIVSQGSPQDYYGLWPLTAELDMLLIQVLCWFVAWSAFVLTVCIAVRHAYHTLKEQSEHRHRVAQKHMQEQEQRESMPQRQRVRVEKPVIHERVTDDFIEEYDTLPVPRSRTMRAYRQASEEWHRVGA
ncbi:MAG TPA: hypothetical protein DHW02_09470, partial [Ktedonobacter sp.]|nr:hypothetical protein [Ktedonobacter sp.]